MRFSVPTTLHAIFVFVCLDSIFYDVCVHAQPSIIHHPTDTTTIVGLTATLTCRIGGVSSGDNYEVKWRSKGREIKYVSERYNLITGTFGISQHDLKISNVTKEDEGEYVCILVCEGYNSVSSKTAYLSVLQTPTFTAQPIDTTFYDGETVVLKCQIENFIESRLKVVWVKDTTFLSYNYEITTSISRNNDNRYSIPREENGIFDLTIKNASRGDNGLYHCFVTFVNSGSYHKPSNRARLSVVSLSCNSEPSNDFYREGDIITTHCIVEGGELEKSDRVFCQLSSNKNTVEDETSPMEGLYKWELSTDDIGGVISCAIQSADKVMGRPYVFGPLNIYPVTGVVIDPLGAGEVTAVQLNTSVTFTCTAHGIANHFDYTWQINDLDINQIDSRYKVDTVGQTLTIDAIQINDDGVRVTCIVNATIGRWNTATTLKVISLHVDESTNSAVNQSSNISTIVLVSMATAAMLVVAMVILVFVYKRRRKKMKTDKRRNMRLQDLQHFYSSCKDQRQQRTWDREDQLINVDNDVVEHSLNKQTSTHYEELPAQKDTNSSTLNSTIALGESNTDGETVMSVNFPDVTYAIVNKTSKKRKNPTGVESGESSLDHVSQEAHYAVPVKAKKGGTKNKNAEGLEYPEVDHTKEQTNQRSRSIASTRQHESPVAYAEIKQRHQSEK